MRAAKAIINLVESFSAFSSPMTLIGSCSDVFREVGLKLAKKKGYTGLLLEANVLPSLSFFKITTIAQLLGCFLIKLSCSFQHFRCLHHAVEEANLS